MERISEEEARSRLAEVQEKISGIEEKMATLRNEEAALRREIDRLISDIHGTGEQALEGQVARVQSNRRDKEKELEGLENEKLLWEKRRAELEATVSNYEQEIKVELYNTLTMRLYQSMVRHNSLVDKVNEELKKMQSLLAQRPSVQTDIRQPGGGWRRVVDIFPEPFIAEHHLRRPPMEKLPLANEKWFKEQRRE